MANVYAVKSGNWSDPTVWNTGALPTTADDVYANNFTVTIDTSPTVLSIRNGATTGIVAGGGFVATNEMNLTCTGLGLFAQTSVVLLSSLTSGQSCTITGNCLVVNSPSVSKAIVHSGAGTINITGNVFGTTGGNPNDNKVISNSGVGIINITGNVLGGGATTSPGDANLNAGVANISSGIVNITGTITGGTSQNGPGVSNHGSGILNHIGIAQAGTGGAAIAVGSTSQITLLTGPFLTTTFSINPVCAIKWKLKDTVASTYLEVQTNDLAIKRNLYTPESVGGNPAERDVREGVLYGPTSDLEGTCAIPPASAVQAGVPVDDTFGTGDFGGNAKSFWDTPASELATEAAEGSIGRRIANAPTAELIGEYLAAFDRV